MLYVDVYLINDKNLTSFLKMTTLMVNEGSCATTVEWRDSVGMTLGGLDNHFGGVRLILNVEEGMWSDFC